MASAAIGPQRTKDFATQLDELRDYLNPREDAEVKAIPLLGSNVPELWLLGRSYEFLASLSGGLMARTNRSASSRA
ncbi:hypothetical protein CFP71_16800 [Amycolatopsis thailandensis]|uniref:Uncharacterized protein n=1 Tax=Amycolatopsis thailandensis TaxID=589330 RepID=A0A229SAC7_9PSEU|nr:hypothetical protein CFP71_16800 [Amycolatopsis thailandensis]